MVAGSELCIDEWPVMNSGKDGGWSGWVGGAGGLQTNVIRYTMLLEALPIFLQIYFDNCNLRYKNLI